MIMALDIATRTGWAMCEPGHNGVRQMVCGTWRLAEGTISERGASLAAHMRAHFSQHGSPERVAIEIPQKGFHSTKEVTTNDLGGTVVEEKLQGNINTQLLLWNLNGSAVSACVVWGVPWTPVGVGEWRKAMFGGGKRLTSQEAKRASMRQLVEWGVKVANQDEAEAGMILAFLNNRLRTIREAAKQGILL